MPYFSNYQHPEFYKHNPEKLLDKDVKEIEAIYRGWFGAKPEPMIVPDGMEFIELTPQDRARADESVRLALLFNIPLEEAEQI